MDELLKNPQVVQGLIISNGLGMVIMAVIQIFTMRILAVNLQNLSKIPEMVDGLHDLTDSVNRMLTLLQFSAFTPARRLSLLKKQASTPTKNGGG